LSNELKQAFNYFEKTKKLPVIMIGAKGEYIVGNTAPDPEPEPQVEVKKSRRPLKDFNEDELAKVVDNLPVYPGGNLMFQAFLDDVTRETAPYLDKDMKKTYVMVEFIIDRDGKTAYAKVIKGGSDELNDKIQEKFENMPRWKPATRAEKNVAIKLKQSLEITR
jgi:hypothetical protein